MGQIPHRADILSISNSFPCSITTTEDHGFSTHSFVRLTSLNGAKSATPNTPAEPHGSDPLNNNRYRIVVTGLDSFDIQYPITYKYVDSTAFTPYVEGGFCNLIETDFFYHGDDEDG